MWNPVPWIQTYTGRRFNPLAPNPADVDVRDIAHALSLQCRYAGHCSRFYSVGEHSLAVSRRVQCHLLPFPRFDMPPAVALHILKALLHDASEAYLVDIPAPVKHAPEFASYRGAEYALQVAIYCGLGLDPFVGDSPEIKQADAEQLVIESRVLMAPLAAGGWDGLPLVSNFDALEDPMQPDEAEREFLRRYVELRQVAEPELRRLREVEP